MIDGVVRELDAPGGAVRLSFSSEMAVISVCPASYFSFF